MTLLLAFVALVFSAWSAWNSHRAARASIRAVQIADRSADASERSAKAAEDSMQIAERATSYDAELLEIERQRRAEELTGPRSLTASAETLKASTLDLKLMANAKAGTVFFMPYFAATHSWPFNLRIKNLGDRLIEEISIKIIRFEVLSGKEPPKRVVFTSGTVNETIHSLAPRTHTSLELRTDKERIQAVRFRLRCTIDGTKYTFERTASWGKGYSL